MWVRERKTHHHQQREHVSKKQIHLIKGIAWPMAHICFTNLPLGAAHMDPRVCKNAGPRYFKTGSNVTPENIYMCVATATAVVLVLCENGHSDKINKNLHLVRKLHFYKICATALRRKN